MKAIFHSISFHNLLISFLVLYFTSNLVESSGRQCKDPSQEASAFDSLAIFIVDSIRVDSLPTIDNVNAKPKLKFLENLAKTNGIVLQTVTKRPTLTIPRTEALLTGRNPSFIDYLYKLNDRRIQCDNIVQQLGRRKGFEKMHFYGDPIWESFFPKSERLFNKMTLTCSLSDHCEDLNLDKKIADEIVKDLQEVEGLNVLIAHWPGIDRLENLDWMLIDQKLKLYDEVGKKIIEHWNLNNKTGLLVVTSDHGTDYWGQHGGGTHYEISTPLLMVSNVQKRGKTYKKTLSTKSYQQIDIPVTLSELFNIEIPLNSNGKLITEALRTLGMDSSSIICSQRRTVERLHESIPLVDNDFYETYGKPEATIEAYDQYMEHLQEVYIIPDRYRLINQILLATLSIILFSISIWILRKEYRSYSILFGRKKSHKNILEDRRKKRNEDKSEENSAFLEMTDKDDTEESEKESSRKSISTQVKNCLESKTAKILCLNFLMIRFLAIGFMYYIDEESLFWNYSGQSLIIILIFCNLINYQNRVHSSKLSIIFTILIFVIYRYILTRWRVIVPVHSWENTVQSFTQNDIYFRLGQLRKANIGVDAFLFVLSILTLALQAQIHIKSNSLYRVLIMLYALVFLYRDQTLSISPVLPFKINSIDQRVYSVTVYIALLTLSLFFCLPRFIRKILRIFQSERNSFYVQAWILICSIILDPKLLPVFTLNVLMEALLNFVFRQNSGKCPSRNGEFFRFVTHLLFAYSSFYQLGNSNSLSTFNVTACFVGMDIFLPIPCVIFTLVAMYSGFLFWILALILRLNQNNRKGIRKESNNRYQECSYGFKVEAKESILRSAIRLGFTWSLGMFGMSSLITFIHQNHVLIWSTILPKYLYELAFTILSCLLWAWLWLCAISLRRDRAK